MVSPLQSIIGNAKGSPNPGVQMGDMLRNQAITNSQLKTQGLQQQSIQQQMGQREQSMDSEQALGAARYINQLGKQLLSADESQWSQILGPQLPQLQQLGYTTEILQGMTREQVQAVVQQTEPLMGQPKASSAPAQVQVRDRLLADLKSTNAEVRQSAAIELGLEGKATGAAPQIVDIGGVPHMFDKQAKRLVPVEIDGKRVTGTTVSKTKAQIKSAVTEASENAKRLADDTGEMRSNEKALNVYDTAMAGLTQALSGTETGLAGWVPAVTSDARIAEGAISAMAPVLKSLFRASGEGTFTDKDQELLLAMIPTRKDDQAAQIAKIENIDAIVRAKLGGGSADPQVVEVDF